MLRSVLLDTSGNDKLDCMSKFELYAQCNSFEISLLVQLSFDQDVPQKVRRQWLNTFQSLSKSIKTNTLQNIFNETELIQKYLFNSCTEYKTYSYFIQNDLIPMIVEYETSDHDLLANILYLYHQKINKRAQNCHKSIFSIFGWLETSLFLILNLSDLLSLIFPTYLNIHHIFNFYLSPILLFIFISHLFIAIKTYNQRRIFCYYLQCISPEIDKQSFKYTPYILEGFNLINLSTFINDDYVDPMSIFPPNRITMYHVMCLSMKYMIGIAYSLCIMHRYIGLFTLFLLPIIVGALSNLDAIHSRIYEGLYDAILTLYKQQSDHLDILPDSDSIYKSIQSIRESRNDTKGWGYSLKLSKYLCGYSLLMICVWPIILLTPFFFGFSIMCHIDPGIEEQWQFKSFTRYWSCFMSVKVIIGMSVVTIFELLWDKLPGSSTTNMSAYDREREEREHADAYNCFCFTTMNVMSQIVIIGLIFGLNSWITHLFRLWAWLIVYIYLTAFGIRQIIPDHQRVMNWRSAFKFKWFNTNVLQTRL